jgi:hypothetical protein
MFERWLEGLEIFRGKARFQLNQLMDGYIDH